MHTSQLAQRIINYRSQIFYNLNLLKCFTLLFFITKEIANWSWVRILINFINQMRLLY
ncbi:hypothetical protein FDUTEX481_04829 [Tolypothrix sp. PCC 7601]|nr:hypothetical protein FDUTEX481_04829 [Tolypothrix sp. PCC 7601]